MGSELIERPRILSIDDGILSRGSASSVDAVPLIVRGDRDTGGCWSTFDRRLVRQLDRFLN